MDAYTQLAISARMGAYTRDIITMHVHLYGSCYIYPLKFSTWALCRDATVHVWQS